MTSVFSRSWIRSLRSDFKDCPPGLFHTSLGSVSPVALTLEVTRGADDSLTGDEAVALVGALLHERHHWLQHIGTVAGVFSSLLIEIQAGLVVGAAPFADVTESDLPLLSSRWRDKPHLILWRRVEAMRRMVYGCWRDDFTAPEAASGQPDFVTTSRVLGDLLRAVGEGGDNLNTRLDAWAADLKPPSRAPKLLGHRKRLVGAKHLMECAARQSEMFRIADLRMRNGEASIDASGFFTGDYGVARHLFYSDLDTLTASTEVGLAYACDVALNGAYPPLAPAAGDLLHEWWTPGAMFAVVANTLKSFPFAQREVDLYEPEDVRALLAEFDDFIAHTVPLQSRHVAAGIVDALGHLDSEQEASALFRIVEGDLPEPTRPAARVRYGLAQTAEAFKMRADSPELFVFPVCRYVDDRKDFRASFDRVPPPLVTYGDSGIAPTRDTTGWLEFFVAAAVVHEFARAAAACTVDDVAARLAPFLRSYGGDEHGRSVLRRALQQVTMDGPLFEPVWERIVASADNGAR